MEWIQSNSPLLEWERIGQNARAVVVDSPRVPEDEEAVVDCGLFRFKLENKLNVVIEFEETQDNSDDGENAVSVRYAYSDFGKRNWATLSAACIPKKASGSGGLTARIPANRNYGGVIFHLQRGSKLIKDSDGQDFFAPFQWRAEAFAVGDETLEVFSYSRKVVFRMESSPKRVHYIVAYNKAEERSEKSLQAEFSGNLARAEAPQGAVGISFVLQLRDESWTNGKSSWTENSGGWTTSDASWYTSLRERSECESEGYYEFPLALNLKTKRVMALTRKNPFWVYPNNLTSTEQICPETLFFVAEVDDGRFFSAVAISDAKKNASCSFRGTPGGFVVRLEASDLGFADSALIAGMALGDSLDYSIRLTNQIASEMLGKRPRHLRLDRRPDFVNELGWCSWDSLGTDVCSDAVQRTVEKLVNIGIPVRWVVIDDGWQNTENRRLVNFDVIDKFGDLKNLCKVLKTDLGIRAVLVWHTVVGYWEGTSETCGLKVDENDSRFSTGLYTNDRVEMVNYWAKNYSVPSNPLEFFAVYYKALREMGIDGVKVDGLGLLEAGGGRGASTAAKAYDFRRAVEQTAEREFNGNVINCMACGNDSVFACSECQSSTVWRSSDDHAFRGVEENDFMVARHIWSNALNGLWLGEHFVTDWDMFRSSGRHGGLHAAVRGISGGPIYISDGEDDDYGVETMAQLVDKNGRTLVCSASARVCERSVFELPLGSGQAFYIWNENPINSVVGAFNLNVEPHTNVRADPAPSDSGILRMKCKTPHTQFGVYGFRSGFLGLVELNERVGPVSLMQPLVDYEVFNIAPVFRLESGVRFCIFGLVGKLNAGAVVEGLASDETSVVITLSAPGLIGLWSDRCPLSISVDGKILSFDRAENLITTADIPGSGAEILVQLTFP
ncbi:hypothetical protein NDN08_006161 [Rhodosorus marinus]|uniref:galactinol--sucrose galactosyltransferase n=1 Tax=Rhodosorus marinus TaxID=101924 RepID=A0AAV8UK11_9RHOD|nr:hypothetical protein NDN08_006161 [Rhodosorus marinus]